MYSIGNYLKETRENLELQLQEVHKKTNINLSLLSRIENGKRLPTKEQVIQLSQVYNCDEHNILVHWLSDKLISEVRDEDFGLEALKVAEETIIYGKSATLFPNVQIKKQIALESRRYIGNKNKLTNWILETILSETENCKSFLDIFAGTGSVAKASFKYFDTVIVNDILHSNNIIYKAFFQISPCDIEKVEQILDDYNNLNPANLDDNYFSLNFGDKFFDYQTAKLIGHIREDLEQKKENLTEKEFSILITTLIYNIDKIANTVGHFDAYIKKPIKAKRLELHLIEPAEFGGIKIYKENANVLARKINADIAYIDPPYNSRQYSRFYHIYDNLVTWEKPQLFGTALKPKAENTSVYCTVGAKNAFRDLVENLDVKYLAVSYNNTYNSKSSSSENKIKLEEIEFILNSVGKTKVFETQYNYLGTDYLETLFLTKVKDK